MTFLTEAIKKLRIVHATKPQDVSQNQRQESFLGSVFRGRRASVQQLTQGPITLWRGMRNLRVAEAFMESLAGGSEVHMTPVYFVSICAHACHQSHVRLKKQ